ncbi:MAG TPA: phytanoyl-CoA dioxygenase family protein [Terriglobales bacterium]|nr:phytanoyl-CoA dioxygenase family protein [Terriglobales bacterium]
MNQIDLSLAACVATASADGWRIEGVAGDGDARLLTLDGAHGRLTLEIRPADPSRRCYRQVGGHAFSYRGSDAQLSASQRQALDATVEALGALLEREPQTLSEPVAGDAPRPYFPAPHHRYHLESELALPAEAIEAFRRDGHLLVRGALAREIVLAARPLILQALARAWPSETVAAEQRRDAYSRAFVQIVNVGLEDEDVRAFTQARRLGRMAADLMGVEGTRIYSEDWLIKQPGAGITPWHQDAAVFPLEASETITIWIPIQDVPAGMGLMRYARGSHRIGIAPVENISDVSEEMFSQIVAEHGFAIDESPPVRAGDVSFHHGNTIHAAHFNQSAETRVVLALHCFADGAVVKEPQTKAMAHQLADFAPELRPGDPAACRKWPLIYSAKDRRAGRMRASKAAAYHLRAVILPGGVATDLWIDDGRFSLQPVAGAKPLGVDNGFAVPGLVDAHSHLSWPHERDTPAHTAAFMDQHRALQAATGVAVLRDMGAADDHILSLADQPRLPRVHASGMIVLRHDDFPFTPTDPDKLRQAFLARIEGGARWIKVFSDWSRDYRGKANTGFTEHDRITYPLEVLRDAVGAAHQAGVRVAAHCFSRAGAEVAIGAGCDSLEHAWGLDEELIDAMAGRGIAWIPLLSIAAPMWRAARHDREPERAMWIERSMERLTRLLPLAHRSGVPIFAGTDWFPEVTVADEIRQLHAHGLSSEAALAAGSWSAREWLGEPGLVDGAPADLVIYRSDPRRSLDTLEQPALILIGGEVADPSTAQIRPEWLPWSRRWTGLERYDPAPFLKAGSAGGAGD